MRRSVIAARSRSASFVVLAVLAGVINWQANSVDAQEGQTLHKVYESSDVVVIAEMIRPQRNQEGEPIVIRNGQIQSFVVTDVKQGSMHIGIGDRIFTRIDEYDSEIERYVIYSRATGNDEDQPWRWSSAFAITPSGLEYLEDLPEGFASLADRLTFFWDALEHDDALISSNAHMEFAVVSDEELALFKDRFDRAELLNWLRAEDATKQQRDLYYMLLSMCGNSEDGIHLQELVASGELPVSESLMACFVILVGEAGMHWLDESYLQNEEVSYAETYQAIIAIRYLSQRKDASIPKMRIKESFRLVLERPILADLVIPDLARLGDWDSMAAIAKLYELSDEQSAWIRIPAINFMRTCPHPEAKEYLKQFQQSDLESFNRAMRFFPDTTRDMMLERAPRVRIRPTGSIESGPFC